MSHLVALLLVSDALTAVSSGALLIRANQMILFWEAAMHPSGKVELLSLNTGSSWTKCISSWVSRSVPGGLLSAGGLDSVQCKPEQLTFSVSMKVAVSELPSCASWCGSVSGHRQSRMKWKVDHTAVTMNNFVIHHGGMHFSMQYQSGHQRLCKSPPGKSVLLFAFG